MLLDDELRDNPTREALQKHNDTKPIWNYYETYLLRPRTKYDLIRAHPEYDIDAAEAEAAERERLRKLEEAEEARIQIAHLELKIAHTFRQQVKDCTGEGHCHGSIGWCPCCGDVGEVCDVEWPYRCDVHERYPEKPPVEQPLPRANYWQPYLPGLDPRNVCVKIFPQPYFGTTSLGKETWTTWLWQHDVSSKVVAKDPTTSKTMLQNCPYPLGLKVGRDTVESIEVIRRGETWYWQLNFPTLTCESCERTDNTVTPVDAMTAYHWDGKGEDPNRDKHLCSDCKEEHVSYWEDMWKEYYSGLL